ncbi:MAG: helix-turn-helix domain-containing protein [Planctomycetes bacterium]|nr:helix-turn-helix domain-containing protein [Planctomycetota bacterium]
MLSQPLPNTIWRLLTAKDIAPLIGVHERKVYQLAQEGKIPATKVGGTWRFDVDTIKKWFKKQMVNNCSHSPSRKSSSDGPARPELPAEGSLPNSEEDSKGKAS